MPEPTIKIRDTRKIDPITGNPVSDKSRMHGEISYKSLKTLIEKANESGVDPYTALAIGLQETNLGKLDQNNIFQIAPNSGYYNEMWNDPYGSATRYMKEKFEGAKKLGKQTDEDIIQSWNGYGTLKGRGVLYGIDTDKTPINMKENPVYGKRIVNLRDSVIKKNVDIMKYIDEASRMKEISKQLDTPQELKCGGKKMKCGGKKKMAEGGIKDYLSELDITKLTGNIVGSLQPEYTDIRENPGKYMEKSDKIAVGGNIAGSTLSGLAKAGPLGAAVGFGIGAITALAGSKKRRQARKEATEDWSNAWAGKAGEAYADAGYEKGGIHIKPENRGKFTAYKKRTGKTTTEALHSKNPHVRQMANFARNAAKWNHAEGGEVQGPGTGKSDSISKNVTDGSFIVPVENAKKAMRFGQDYLGWNDGQTANKDYDGSTVKLSDGEVLFTPEEVEVLQYHGVDLDELAPNATNKIEPGAKLQAGTVSPEEPPKPSQEEFVTDWQNKYEGSEDDAIAAYNEAYPEIDNSGSEEEPPTLMQKLESIIPEVAGAIQVGAGFAGIRRAGRMPDINVSTALKELAAEQRKEAQYGLEPGTKTAMKIATERERRNATNALVARGGGAGELQSNLQGLMSTAINSQYQTELSDAAEKARKKSEYARTKTAIGAQEFDAQRYHLENWKEMQMLNADLLSAGISNIVGARKMKAEIDALKKIEESRKLGITIKR